MTEPTPPVPAPPPTPAPPPRPRRSVPPPPPERADHTRCKVMVLGSMLFTFVFVIVALFLINEWYTRWSNLAEEMDQRRNAFALFERGRVAAQGAERQWLLNVASRAGRDPGADVRSLVDEAILNFDDAIATYPKYLEAYEWAGRAAMLDDRYDAAIGYFDRLLDRVPDSSVLYDLVMARAFVYFRRWTGLTAEELERERSTQTRYPDALRDARRYFEDRGSDMHHSIVMILLNLLEGRPGAEMYEAIQNMEDYDPTDWHVRFLRGWVMLADGRAQEAMEAADVLLARFPRVAEGHALKARALEALSRPQDALGEWTMAIALDARFAEAYWARARLQVDDAAAGADRARARELAPDLEPRQ